MEDKTITLTEAEFQKRIDDAIKLRDEKVEQKRIDLEEANKKIENEREKDPESEIIKGPEVISKNEQDIINRLNKLEKKEKIEIEIPSKVESKFVMFDPEDIEY